MNKRISVFALTIAAILAAGTLDGRAQSLMTRHVRDAVVNGQALLLGRLPANQKIQLNIVLPLRDQEGLDEFLSDLRNPASASYRQFLTPQEFTARFGPTQETELMCSQSPIPSPAGRIFGSRRSTRRAASSNPSSSKCS